MKNAPKRKAEKFKVISTLQLQKLLMEKPINGGTFIYVLTDTKEGNLKNAKTCELAGLRKITATVGHAYAHHQYANQMLKKNPEYVPQGRTWGTRLKNCPLVEHKGNYYLELFFDNGKSKTKNLGYFLDGKEIDKAKVREALLPKKEELIIYRNYSLDSIMEIKFAGVRYKVIAS
jgi:hypothetical protein